MNTLIRPAAFIALASLVTIGLEATMTGTLVDSRSAGLHSSPQRTLGVALGDVNGDDRLDALFAHGVAAGGFPNDVCLNPSSEPLFPSCTELSSDRFLSGEITLGDLDGEGDLDAVVANNGETSFGAPNRVCFNDEGIPHDSSCIVVTERRTSLDVALGDLDGDGDLDAVFANGGLQFQLEHVCLNDGGFSRATSCEEIGP